MCEQAPLNLLDRSIERAGPSIAATFARPDRRLNADAFREFWRATRMFAVATNGNPSGATIARGVARVNIVDNDAKHSRRDVTIGHRNDSSIEITGGLVEGDKVLSGKPEKEKNN